MPLTSTRDFRVRHYECDLYGHVNNANYLRYMQEAAFDASALAGYDTARYAAMGLLWLARETQIDFLQPLRYGDTVEVKTWVSGFRGATSRRRYEIRRAGTGEAAATAHTDWVLLDAATLRPVRIPSGMAAAFFPEGVPAVSLPRDSFPEVPPAPPGTFKIRRRVALWEIDPAGHVNNAAYLEYVEDCGMQVIAAHGWPAARMAEEGFAIVIRQHRIEYIQPAVLDDELEISTWAFEVKRSSAQRHYAITRISDGSRVARVNSLGVWMDLATGRPIRIPPEFVQEFQPNLAS